MRRSRLRVPAIAVGVFAAALALAPALPAAAHNYVVSSTPAEGETLTAVPEFFVITTNDALLDLTGAGAGFVMQVTDENGLFYGDGCVSVQGASMAMAGALGAAGAYTITYQAISGDGHTISDSLSFRYEPTAGVQAQPGVASVPDCGESAAVADSDAETSGDGPDSGSEVSAVDEASTVVGVVVGLVAAAVVLAVIVALVVRRRSGAVADDARDETMPPSGA